MSSREIAELTGKRHDHVIVDIRKMLDGLGLNSPDFSGQYIDSTGRSLPCFNLPKRETMILVSGYSIPLRARIIDRWMELEAAAAQPQPVTPAVRLHQSRRGCQCIGARVGMSPFSPTSEIFSFMGKLLKLLQ